MLREESSNVVQELPSPTTLLPTPTWEFPHHKVPLMPGYPNPNPKPNPNPNPNPNRGQPWLCYTVKYGSIDIFFLYGFWPLQEPIATQGDLQRSCLRMSHTKGMCMLICLTVLTQLADNAIICTVSDEKYVRAFGNFSVIDNSICSYMRELSETCLCTF